MDAETSDRGVKILSLNTAAAHACSRVSRNAPPGPLASDDDTEGVIRLTNAYFKSPPSIASRVEALTDMVALSSCSSGKQVVRFIPESSIYTSTIRVCPCVLSLSPLMATDLAVTETLTEEDGDLSLSNTKDSDGHTVFDFALPTEGHETNESILSKAVTKSDGDNETMGLERRVALALLQVQRVITL